MVEKTFCGKNEDPGEATKIDPAQILCGLSKSFNLSEFLCDLQKQADVRIKLSKFFIQCYRNISFILFHGTSASFQAGTGKRICRAHDT